MAGPVTASSYRPSSSPTEPSKREALKVELMARSLPDQVRDVDDCDDDGAYSSGVTREVLQSHRQA